MAFEKGISGNPNGRPPGTPNKSTTRFKMALNALLEDNSDKLQAWIEQIAQDDAHKAIDQISKLAEYVYPKLSRTTHAGDTEHPLVIQEIRRTVIDSRQHTDATNT